MKQLPFPLRVAAGIAVTTAERARDLPKQLTELPVTVASQVLQASMRVQQQITELAIKGDDALSALRPIEESPSWATFDEDEDTEEHFGAPAVTPTADDNGQGMADEDPWVAEERALAEEHTEGEFDSPGSPSDGRAPAGLSDYDQLSLPQVRARLRQFSLTELEELLAYEREHANRPSFTGMLTRRIGNVRQATAEENGPEDPAQ